MAVISISDKRILSLDILTHLIELHLILKGGTIYTISLNCFLYVNIACDLKVQRSKSSLIVLFYIFRDASVEYLKATTVQKTNIK